MNRDPSGSSLRIAAPTFSPLYRQIKDFMIRSLEAGEWSP
jgi:GntR family transcriptional regulator